MATLDTSIIELLRGVRVDLAYATGGTTVSLARPRARLAWIASLIPPECTEQRRLLDMSAQVVAEIGLGKIGGMHDISRLRAAVTAVTAVLEYFANPWSAESSRIMAEAAEELTSAAARAREVSATGSMRVADLLRSGQLPSSRPPDAGIPLRKSQEP